MGAMTLLNEAGDVTIVWEEQNDGAIEELVQRLMDRGVTFFVIEPRMGGVAPPDKKKMKKFGDALKHRALAIPDEEVAKFVEEGRAVAVRTPDAPVKKSRVSRSAKEVAKSESVGVRPRSGG